jgi:hypothetical protein
LNLAYQVGDSALEILHIAINSFLIWFRFGICRLYPENYLLGLLSNGFAVTWHNQKTP